MRDAIPEDFWTPVVAIFGMQILLFFVAQLIKDNSIVDLFWGVGIALPNLVILIVNKNMGCASYWFLNINLIYDNLNLLTDKKLAS